METTTMNTEVVAVEAAAPAQETPAACNYGKMDGKKIALIATGFTALGVGLSIGGKWVGKKIKNAVANGKAKRAEKKAAKAAPAQETVVEDTEE